MSASDATLTELFEAASLQLATSLKQMEIDRKRRRHRWNEDVMLMRDMFHLENRRNNNMSLTYAVTSLFMEGMADIAAMRVLCVFLPMLQTLQRIELDTAKIPGFALFPEDDIRFYTGNLRRIED